MTEVWDLSPMRIRSRRVRATTRLPQLQLQDLGYSIIEVLETNIDRVWGFLC